MFDLSWAEMGVIVVTAAVVIGPKDMPKLVRVVGRGWAKFRRFGHDMRAQFDASPLGQELREAQAEVEREARVIYDAQGNAYERFSLDGLTDASRPTIQPAPQPLPEPRSLPAADVTPTEVKS